MFALFRSVALSSLIVLLITGVLIAVLPEPPAKLLTAEDAWDVKGATSSRVSVSSIPAKSRYVRRSESKSPGGLLFRTWTPENGVVPLEVSSPPFPPARYLSVLITGNSRTVAGGFSAWIECGSNGQRLPVFNGSVNVNVTEAIVLVPEGWCQGDARLKFTSSLKSVNVGVGGVFEISLLSYLKSGFLGRVPYLAASFILFSLVMLAGTALTIRKRWYDDPLPVAFISLGAFALLTFYLTALVPERIHWLGSVGSIVLSLVLLKIAGRAAVTKAFTGLKPFAVLWSVSALVYFAILGLAYNGLGHWEPNYRFWPAAWSSDNELPWLFAEALKRGWPLQSLFGSWLPTDRPPLMTAAHLMLSDVFALMQSGNDGDYLLGRAYNASAVLLGALWVPACWWLLLKLRPHYTARDRYILILYLGCLPFVIFNTIYGWPKAFGAAYAILAFGFVWQMRKPPAENYTSMILVFFLLGAVSMLAHTSTALFLLPLGLVFLWWNLARNPKGILIGIVVALAVVGSWSLYKAAVLPSPSPVTKYALTGDYGFSKPGSTLWDMLYQFYGGIDFRQWIEIKVSRFLQSFLPVGPAFGEVRFQYGSGVVDRLRGWDFFMLTKGNATILLFVILVFWHYVRSRFNPTLNADREDRAFVVLTAVSLASWLLIVLAFIAPVILHHWPLAALFGLALGGAVLAYETFPRTFAVAFILQGLYAGVVWLLSPIRSALYMDYGAAVTLGMLLVMALSASFLSSRDTPVSRRVAEKA